MRLLLIALLLSGCAASTQVIRYGAVVPEAHLVTLVVTESLEVAQAECKDASYPVGATLLGCQSMQLLAAPSGEPFVRAVRIVRYTDFLPSQMALEIEAHELCHAVAALQFIQDPCHTGNNGEIAVSKAQSGGVHGAIRR